MRYDREAQIREPLAFLRAAGEGDELIRRDGDGGDAFLFKSALVNYQP